MTTPYKYFKEASDKALVDRHERSKRKSYFERVCAKCDAVQPESAPVNQPCNICGNPVVMVIPTKEAE